MAPKVAKTTTNTQIWLHWTRRAVLETRGLTLTQNQLIPLERDSHIVKLLFLWIHTTFSEAARRKKKKNFTFWNGSHAFPMQGVLDIHISHYLARGGSIRPNPEGRIIKNWMAEFNHFYFSFYQKTKFYLLHDTLFNTE